ncbi:DUF420 domain-containing protein [Sporolactobacillus spathodeae]|uniref:Membrane protein n=1 Tax=Sporolactobacillus spathodeae TaxID=1465502 RepID=A0ABS2Q740_9BACL|nr:putative membrane protein [Sporolactobacillus spathodeae]
MAHLSDKKSVSTYKPKSNKNHTGLIITVAVIANILILLLFFAPFMSYHGKISSSIYVLPKLNAVFNSFTFIFLVAALLAVKQKKINLHRGFILAACTSTAFFLLSYLSFHFLTPTPHYGGTGFVRSLYFFVLITHSFLAASVVFLVPFTIVWGWTFQIGKHKKIVRWTLPIWLYVSITGVVVYLMMAPYY